MSRGFLLRLNSRTRKSITLTWVVLFILLINLVTPVPSGVLQGRQDFFWFGWSILIIMAAGVLIIILNYVGKMPGTGWTTQNWPLFTGLGLIGLGFVLATAWH